MKRTVRLGLMTAALVGGIAVLPRTLVDAQGTGGVFFSEGWESGTASSSFNSRYYGSAVGPQFRAQNIIRAGGNWALEHHMLQGLQPPAIQYATQHFGDAVSGPVHSVGQGQRFDDLFVQYKVYYPDGFDFSARGYKQLIIGTEDDRRHENVCCNPWVSSYITIYPAHPSREPLVAEANNKQSPTSQWVGFYQNSSGYSSSNLFRIQTNRWYTIEVRRRLNDTGVDNGIFQMWINGILIADHRTVRFRVPWNGTYGSNFNYGTNFAMISDYTMEAVTRDQSIYYDDIKFGTSYIGMDVTAPSPPTNVRITR